MVEIPKGLPPLGGMSVTTFLQDYWQQQPLIIRQAFPDFETPLSPEELAGLSCEEEVNSRIIIEKGGDHSWQAIHGPMTEEIFASMPETHWTLVVNDLEKTIPELAWITDQFRFIPEWYLDDLMSSYAAPEGTVGPHFDLYDVFILQGSGQRRWQISTQPVAEDNIIPDVAIRLQKDFTAEIEWILEPGDMMYLPAGVSHYGVSIGESMSYSIGFKATSHEALVSDFIAYITRELPISKTYHLPNEGLATHPAQITAAAIAEIRTIFKNYLDPQHPQLARWFGSFVSDSKTDFVLECEQPVDSFEQLLALQKKFAVPLLRHPASRFAFTAAGQPQAVMLFVDGQELNVSKTFVYQLCDQRTIDLMKLSRLMNENERDLLLDLYNAGKLYFANE